MEKIKPSLNELIPTINQIVQYGLEPSISVKDSLKSLEKNLVEIHRLSFDIVYELDNNDYSEFDKSVIPNIRQNIESNFKNFGYYKTVNNIEYIEDLSDCTIGDAIDDLNDIIIDLLEIKWRSENNSLNDGLWYFELIFHSHTKQHILNLLNYIKQIND